MAPVRLLFVALVSLFSSWVAAAPAKPRLPGPGEIQLTLEKSSPEGLQQIYLSISDEGRNAILTRNSTFGLSAPSVSRLGKFESRNSPAVTAEWSLLKTAAVRILERQTASKNSPLRALRTQLPEEVPTVGQAHPIRYRLNGVAFDIRTPWGKILEETSRRILDEANWSPVDAVAVGPVTGGAKGEAQASLVPLAGGKAKASTLKCDSLGPTASGKKAYRCTAPGYGVARLITP
jgi:hypothetical protein